MASESDVTSEWYHIIKIHILTIVNYQVIASVQTVKVEIVIKLNSFHCFHLVLTKLFAIIIRYFST